MLITVKMSIIFGILNHDILTFISMINTTSESLKARKVFSFHHCSFMSSLNFMLDLGENVKKFYNLEIRPYFFVFRMF